MNFFSTHKDLVLHACIFILMCGCGSNGDASDTARFTDSKVIVTSVVDAFLDVNVSGESVIPVGGDEGIVFLDCISNAESDFPYPILDRWGNPIEVLHIEDDVWVVRSASYDQEYGNDDDITIYVDKSKNIVVGGTYERKK